MEADRAEFQKRFHTESRHPSDSMAITMSAYTANMRMGRCILAFLHHAECVPYAGGEACIVFGSIRIDRVILQLRHGFRIRLFRIPEKGGEDGRSEASGHTGCVR
jgi:hypothetical protein